MSGGTIITMSNGVEDSFGNYLYTEMLGWLGVVQFKNVHQRGGASYRLVMRNFGGGKNKLH